jgi:hypothetical protein
MKPNLPNLDAIKSEMKDFIGRGRPAAKTAWFVVGLILLAGLFFNGYHNIKLYPLGISNYNAKRSGGEDVKSR